MINRVSAALRRIQSDLAQVLDAEQITEVCSEVGYRFRKRILDPTTTIHLFVTQIVNGNFAVARLEEFTDKQFSEAAYCNARGRLPVQVLQTLLKRVGSALQPILNDAGRWRKHRTFHIDGSAFSMPDTEELLTAFGQPGRQRAGCQGQRGWQARVTRQQAGRVGADRVERPLAERDLAGEAHQQ